MEGQLGLMSQNRNAIAKVEPDKTTKEPESPVGTERLMDVSNVKQPLNQPNRRVRTRTHGGVGRLGPRGPGLPRWAIPSLGALYLGRSFNRRQYPTEVVDKGVLDLIEQAT